MPIESSSKRSIVRLGEQVTVRNYDGFGSTDAHGDADPTLSADSPHTGVPARSDPRASADGERRRGFSTLDYDMVFIFPDDEAAAQGLAGMAEPDAPSEIERPSGDTYRVIRVLRDRDGAIVAAAEAKA